MNKNLEIEESLERLQVLFDELKQEVDGKTLPSGVCLPPSAGSYYQKAEKLVEEAANYSKLDDSFNINAVFHTFCKEVEFVRDYTDKGKTPKIRQKELVKLMNKATHQLFIDFCGVIK